jgi:hypothetical protein
MEMSSQLYDLLALLPVSTGWMGPRAGLNLVWNRKILVAAGNRTPAVQNVANLGSFRYDSSLVTSSRTSKCKLLLVQAKH